MCAWEAQSRIEIWGEGEEASLRPEGLRDLGDPLPREDEHGWFGGVVGGAVELGTVLVELVPDEDAPALGEGARVHWDRGGLAMAFYVELIEDTASREWTSEWPLPPFEDEAERMALLHVGDGFFDALRPECLAPAPLPLRRRWALGGDPVPDHAHRVLDDRAIEEPLRSVLIEGAELLHAVAIVRGAPWKVRSRAMAAAAASAARFWASIAVTFGPASLRERSAASRACMAATTAHAAPSTSSTDGTEVMGEGNWLRVVLME